jgi:hypothetical protein
LAKNQSKSFKYAKKKCITIALKSIANQQQFLQEKKPEYSDHLKKAQAEKKQAFATKQQQKQEALLTKAAAKKIEKVARLKAKELVAKQKDKQRQLAKKDVKEKTNRKGKDTIYREYTKEEIAAISVSKKRNLQDKGILPQGV